MTGEDRRKTGTQAWQQAANGSRAISSCLRQPWTLYSSEETDSGPGACGGCVWCVSSAITAGARRVLLIGERVGRLDLYGFTGREAWCG